MRSSFGHLGIAKRALQRAQARPPLPRERPLDHGTETYAEIALAPAVLQHLKPVEYRGASPLQGRVFTVSAWDRWTMEERIAFLRAFVEDKARDPMIARKATQIIREARVRLKDHRGEWAALLRWVQRNVRFTAEPNERIQSPQYTLTERMGDCDDCSLLLAGLGHSIRLPWRFVLLGRRGPDRVQWVEGVGACPRDVNWHHIYLYVGWPPFRPAKWTFGEPTLDVPLGFDPFKSRAPRDRKDLGGTGGVGGLWATLGVGGEKPENVPGREAALVRMVRGQIAKIAWYNVAGSVIGAILSGLILRHMLGVDDRGRTR